MIKSIAKIFGFKTDASGGVGVNMEYEHVLIGLEEAKDSINQAYFTTLNQITELKREMERALKNKEKDKAVNIAVHIHNQKKIAVTYKTIANLVENAIFRIREAKSVEPILRTLSFVLPQLQGASTAANEKLKLASASLARAIQGYRTLESNVEVGIGSMHGIAEAESENSGARYEGIARDLLFEASRAAAEEVNKVVGDLYLPEPPEPRLEDRVYMYLVENKGKPVRVSEIARQFNLSASDARRILGKLAREGKVKLLQRDHA
ncbi:MAG: helix-turn-helix domain-containing protein [Desulfurococcales archaeon]|nr:helix-turn-helix domain-containing protein [Desulfurococcales archaeon]